MKTVYLVCLLVFCTLFATGQKKKEIKKNKIKSVTETVTGEEGGVSVDRKDGYEKFSQEGKSVLKIEYKKDGTVKHQETNIYDSYGNLTEETLYDLKDQKNSKKTYKYNALKDKTEEIEYKGGKMVSKTVFTYNADGNVVSETVFDASEKLKKKITYTYNKKKLKETKTTTDPDGTVKSVKNYTYEFY